MWTIWRINWQIVKISVSCKIFVLTSTYLLSNILQKRLSTIDITSQNCSTLHLYPPSVNVIQMVTQSVQSVSARLLIYFELLYRKKGQETRRHLVSLTLVYTHLTHSMNTEHCEAQYNANSLIVTLLTKAKVAQLKNCVSEKWAKENVLTNMSWL